jgi:hypothetical protein
MAINCWPDQALNWSQSILFTELKRFLILAQADNSTTLQMYSRPVDEFWHQFILFTASILSFVSGTLHARQEASMLLLGVAECCWFIHVFAFTDSAVLLISTAFCVDLPPFASCVRGEVRTTRVRDVGPQRVCTNWN